jgi:hypothetical protein
MNRLLGKNSKEIGSYVFYLGHKINLKARLLLLE